MKLYGTQARAKERQEDLAKRGIKSSIRMVEGDWEVRPLL